MVTSAALLLRQHGVAGTSFAKVLEHAEAPRGSLGHHFPGGKSEMVADAVRWAGRLATDAMRNAVARGATPAAVFGLVCRLYRRALVDSDFAAACPVGAVAQEAWRDEAVSPVVAEVVQEWRAVMHEALVTAGRPADIADDLAELCIAGLEGALMLARVQRSPEPLDRVARQLAAILDSECSEPR